jgi:hypothetical protein
MRHRGKQTDALQMMRRCLTNTLHPNTIWQSVLPLLLFFLLQIVPAIVGNSIEREREKNPWGRWNMLEKMRYWMVLDNAICWARKWKQS